MSRFGLSLRFLSATLFIATGLRAQDMLPAMAQTSQRAQEVLKKYDKNGDGRIDDDERADAQEVMLKERIDRQVQFGVGAPEALRARLIEVFDKNRDGRLDDGERAAVAEYAPGVNPALRGEIMQRFDRDRDGKIDETERATMFAFLAEARPTPATDPMAVMRRELLVRFDRNADGKIEVREMDEAEKLLRPEIENNAARRERYDVNGDGKLDDAEWRAARIQLIAWLNEGAVPRVNTPEEKARLEAVAKEVARRRALRGEAMESNAPSVESAPSAPKMSAAEEQTRLANVAEEVRRRRVERERLMMEKTGK